MGDIDLADLFHFLYRYIDLDGCWGIALPVFEFLAGIAAEVVEAALVAGGTANAIENCEEVYDWWQERKKQKEAYKTELEEEKANEKKQNSDVYAPDRPLPKDKHGIPIPDTDASHTQLGTKDSRRNPGEKYPQAREFDKEGNTIRDIDFTDHGKPDKHPNPHQHTRKENKTGGTRTREKAEPLPNWEYK